MTAFVNDDGEYLDYSGADVGIVKQCANFFDFKIKGDVSATMKIPNNSHNRDVLGYYGAQQLDSPAFSKIPFSMVKDGNVISRGSLIIKDSDEDTINVFFVSGNTNWFQKFQFNLKEIVYPDSYTVQASSTTRNSTVTDGIVFPLVDWGYNGNRRSRNFYLRAFASYDGGYIQDTFPCLYMHTLVTHMAEWAGVKIDGDLIDDPLFKKIVITPSGANMNIADSIVKKTMARVGISSPFTPSSSPQQVPVNFIFDIGDASLFNTSTYKYTCPVDGTYQITYRTVYDYPGVGTTYGEIQYLNGGASRYVFIDATNNNNATFRGATNYVNAVKGDQIAFYIDTTVVDYPTLGTDTFFEISLASEAPGAFLSRINSSAATYYIVTKYLPSAVAPDMKAIDFIKFLVNYFSCVTTFDEYSNTLHINKINGIRKEAAEDWSDYFVSASTNYNTGIATNNYIQMADSDEEKIIDYNRGTDVKFGSGVIETNFDSIDRKTLYASPFGASYDAISKTKLDSKTFLPYIKFWDLSLDESTFMAYTTVSSASGARFNGSANEMIAGDLVFVQSNSREYSGYGIIESASSTTINLGGVDFGATDAGRIIKVTVSGVNGKNRLLIVTSAVDDSYMGFSSPLNYWFPGNALGSSTEFDSNSGTAQYDTLSTIRAAWFDKPVLGLPIDIERESLAIDQIGNRVYNTTISERYYGQIKSILNNPRVDAMLLLPVSVFTRFNFDRYIYLETKDLTGYFLIQKIENYKDATTPVKCELLYVDGPIAGRNISDFDPATEYTMSANYGSFTLGGQAVTLRPSVDHVMTANAGYYILGGQPVDITYIGQYPISLTVYTIDAVLAYSASFDGPNEDGGLSIAAPANGQTDNDLLDATAGAQSVYASANKTSGVALESWLIEFYRNAGLEHTDTGSIGTAITGDYTYPTVYPGDTLDIVITEL